LIPRIILDRSIFHKEGFTNLKKSPLTAHVVSGTIQVLYTAHFIEETIQYGFVDSSHFRTQWDYLTSLNSSKWFKHTNALLATELGKQIVGRKYYLRPKGEIRQIIQNAPHVIDRQMPVDQFKQANDQISQNNLRSEELRRQIIAMRQKHGRTNYDFGEVVRRSAEWYIEKGLMTWHANSEGYLSVWRSNRAKCRFSNSHIRAALATLLLPLVDHQLKLDRNDKTDAEQLAFLEWADIFVSDDTKFMKRAFDFLYHDCPKKFMCSSDFISYLEQL
jgi:hypothetical protein